MNEIMCIWEIIEERGGYFQLRNIIIIIIVQGLGNGKDMTNLF